MKYCWEYTDDYLEYRSSCGLDTKNPRWYIKDLVLCQEKVPVK